MTEQHFPAQQTATSHNVRKLNKRAIRPAPASRRSTPVESVQRLTSAPKVRVESESSKQDMAASFLQYWYEQQRVPDNLSRTDDISAPRARSKLLLLTILFSTAPKRESYHPCSIPQLTIMQMPSERLLQATRIIVCCHIARLDSRILRAIFTQVHSSTYKSYQRFEILFGCSCVEDTPRPP